MAPIRMLTRRAVNNAFFMSSPMFRKKSCARLRLKKLIKEKKPSILKLLILTVRVACLFLPFVTVAAAASTLSHHYKQKCADRQIPEEVC